MQSDHKTTIQRMPVDFARLDSLRTSLADIQQDGCKTCTEISDGHRISFAIIVEVAGCNGLSASIGVYGVRPKATVPITQKQRCVKLVFLLNDQIRLAVTIKVLCHK